MFLFLTCYNRYTKNKRTGNIVFESEKRRHKICTIKFMYKLQEHEISNFSNRFKVLHVKKNCIVFNDKYILILIFTFSCIEYLYTK